MTKNISDHPILIVLMGVAGCGKSSVGAALAPKIKAEYIDGDDLHPPTNIAKMSRGEPLNDDDRWPWLESVGRTLGTVSTPTIIGCSSLKKAYREKITKAANAPVIFVHLSGSREVIEDRMSARAGHFMPTSLLDSQFAALEPLNPTENAIIVDIDQPLVDVVSSIVRSLKEKSPDISV